jgi:prevent-host-death family protein
MRELGVFEAKTKFSELCRQVARSRKPVTVTLHGQPMVRIVPVEVKPEKSVWESRAEFDEQHGKQTEDFELPKRTRQTFRNVLDE